MEKQNGRATFSSHFLYKIKHTLNIETETYIWMFLTASVIIAKTRCTSINKLINYYAFRQGILSSTKKK
jgi:hypothetical protein